YSPILGGGDCDDADPSVHPGAYDVPGNGRDENCSGADAVAWTPPAPPAFVRPAALAAHPNVVVVVVDALRPDRLGFAGNPRPVS
ncbi:putative metal-binding motif-containing protein, partial [Acinetobacter baumannii]|uniref:putative metal-binding motif-containing protein n=1 Tax=Acinetobacter baumannii TaxID=470 RepID=UPI0037D7B074